MHSARSSFSSTQYANNARRVSFAEDEKAKATQNAKDGESKDQSRKTNERRREEARKATEVSWSCSIRPQLLISLALQIGQAANGTPEDNVEPTDPAALLQQMQSQTPQYGQMPNAFNPYFGMSNAPFMDPTQQMYMLQMQMAQMAQMAQMNPGMMQMQQQA
jgi:hypothetical protein